MVVLQKYSLIEFTLHNELGEQKSGSFQLKPQISFSVLPKQENKPFTGELNVEIGNMDDATPLYIKVKLKGFFLYVPQKDEEPKPLDIKEFHRHAFPILFDVARSLISGTTLMGGMTPFSLPPIKPDQINFGGNNALK